MSYPKTKSITQKLPESRVNQNHSLNKALNHRAHHNSPHQPSLLPSLLLFHTYLSSQHPLLLLHDDENRCARDKQTTPPHRHAFCATKLVARAYTLH
jgi:hypothetical protein